MFWYETVVMDLKHCQSISKLTATHLLQVNTSV